MTRGGTRPKPSEKKVNNQILRKPSIGRARRWTHRTGLISGRLSNFFPLTFSKVRCERNILHLYPQSLNAQQGQVHVAL